MNDSVLIVLIFGASIILAVIAYNMYQENQFRKQLREQFGHTNKDALLDSHVQSVRDGLQQNEELAEPPLTIRQTDLSEQSIIPPTTENEAEYLSDEETELISLQSEASELDHQNTFQITHPTEPILQVEEAPSAPIQAFDFIKRKVTPPPQTKPQLGRKTLLDVHDMMKQPLPWFDRRFDYLACIALHKPMELHAMPRLSSRHRFQLIGCTMDGRYQVAEPIPSVYYQGFIIGLQAISRSGLASQEELEQFGQHANTFAEKLDGQLLLTEIKPFLELAKPLDELCIRVDQTIILHLRSRTNISGTELRATVERHGFELSHDGTFAYKDKIGEALFNIITIDGTPFTTNHLSTQTYPGFSVSFNSALVPDGEKHFNELMDIVVSISSTLNLDLVDDRMRELSIDWMRQIRAFVAERQVEMKEVHIEPGGALAKRLFS